MAFILRRARVCRISDGYLEKGWKSHGASLCPVKNSWCLISRRYSSIQRSRCGKFLTRFKRDRLSVECQQVPLQLARMKFYSEPQPKVIWRMGDYASVQEDNDQRRDLRTRIIMKRFSDYLLVVKH